ncbi:MAG TPA: carboxypeptidase-like regulatory domain-containing protein [Candidatus Angelobacter sp.]|nr:carboxypeptidase-like regulatory domain-containing protein [Candidatus Angelobacter sp.]
MFQPKARIAILVVFFIVAISMALAQGGNQGAISGTVTDPSGALVPGTEVRATNTATGASFTTNTTNDGLFEFAQLPVGI